MKRLMLILMMCGVMGILSASEDKVLLTEETDAKGEKLVVVENPWYLAKFIENPGGWCVSFKMPKDGEDWIPQAEAYEKGGKMFVHNLAGQHWGGNSYAKLRREITVETQTPEKLVLKMFVAPGAEPGLDQLMTFSADSPAIAVDLALVNPGGQGMTKGLWPHFLFYPGGDRANNYFFKPGVNGVEKDGWDPKLQRNAGDNDFMRTPVAGWMASLNAELKTGMVFVMDYNYLHVLYNCLPAWTTEWFYEEVPLLPGGGTWKTRYYAIPVEGFTSIAYASENVIIEHIVKPGKNGLEIETGCIAATEPLKELSVKLDWKSIGANAEPVSIKPQQFKSLGYDIQSLIVPLTGAPKGKSIIFNATVEGINGKGEKFQEEYIWVNKESDFMKFDLVAGKAIPIFTQKQPKKIKVYDKPKNISVLPKPGCPLLEMRGPGYYRSKVAQAATIVDIIDIKGSWFKRNFNGSSVSYFPIDYDELLNYNVMVLNDVDAYCLSHFQTEMLVDFVKAGGGLLVIGGPYSLSNGQYNETQINEILPVEITGKPFSFKKIPAGKRTIKKADEAVVLADVNIPSDMECYWMEDVKPKPGATVELIVGDKPFLICGEVKGPASRTGRVAVIPGSVFGEGAKGFYDNPEWPKLLSEVLNWLNYGAKIDWSNNFRTNDK